MRLQQKKKAERDWCMCAYRDPPRGHSGTETTLLYWLSHFFLEMPSSYAKQKSMTCHFVSCCRRCLRNPCGGTQRAVANSCWMKAAKSARKCFNPAFLRLLQVILFGPRILYTWTRSQGAPEHTQYTHPSQFELIDSHINAQAFGGGGKMVKPRNC